MSDLEIPAFSPHHRDHAVSAALRESGDLLLTFATVLIPGHGAPFRPRPHA